MERNKSNKPPRGNETSMFICALIGGGIGLALTLMLALIMPMALINSGDPNSLAGTAAAICIALGGITGAITAAKKSKESKFLAGMLAAAVMLVPIALVSLVIPGSYELKSALISVGALIIAASVGAFAVAKISSDSKRNMKKVMKRR